MIKINYEYFVRKSNGEYINIKELNQEQTEKVRKGIYQQLVTGLGYRPVKTAK